MTLLSLSSTSGFVHQFLPRLAPQALRHHTCNIMSQKKRKKKKKKKTTESSENKLIKKKNRSLNEWCS
jgi:hypothetical protein